MLHLDNGALSLCIQCKSFFFRSNDVSARQYFCYEKISLLLLGKCLNNCLHAFPSSHFNRMQCIIKNIFGTQD